MPYPYLNWNRAIQLVTENNDFTVITVINVALLNIFAFFDCQRNCRRVNDSFGQTNLYDVIEIEIKGISDIGVYPYTYA
jgi:hypothetical protein